MKNGEDAMITEKDLVPILHGASHLQEILATSGFTPADFETLVNSELETSDLLRYIDALLSNRMN
jgi:predicted nucleotidyltransferase